MFNRTVDDVDGGPSRPQLPRRLRCRLTSSPGSSLPCPTPSGATWWPGSPSGTRPWTSWRRRTTSRCRTASRWTAIFEDLGDGRSRVTSTSLVDSFEGRDAFVASGMESGVVEGYEKLDELLAGLPVAPER
jgi:hypothetical protein